MEQEWINDSISKINSSEKRRYKICLLICILVTCIFAVISLTWGQYHISIKDVMKTLGHILFDVDVDVSKTIINVVKLIRLPRTLAAFIVGSCLAVSGYAFQSIFNNQLVSSDVLGVSSGACVGAAVAILLGANSFFVGVFAFISGLLSVFVALLLPKLFRSNKNITLVLSGIIVGSLMNSVIGGIKFLADREEKLAEITFWIMGNLAGVTYSEIGAILPLFLVSLIGIIMLRWKINVLSLGEDEARTLGMNYGLYRTLVIVFSTVLTAASVSLSGNVGWIGLVVPHIGRALVGGDSRYAVPIACVFGGGFMIIVDLLARNLSVDEIPLSIITGLFGTAIYIVVLRKKGRELHE